MNSATLTESVPLRLEAQHFLQDLRSVQRALLELQAPKRDALIQGNWEQVRMLEQDEAEGQRRLHGLLEQRKHWLRKCQQQGLAGKSLQEIGRELDWHREPAWQSLLSEVLRNNEHLRRESWGMWVLAQRGARCYAQILDLIAQGGQRSPVYQQRSDTSVGGGGTLLDASI